MQKNMPDWNTRFKRLGTTICDGIIVVRDAIQNSYNLINLLWQISNLFNRIFTLVNTVM